jgi:hypothetical protein
MPFSTADYMEQGRTLADTKQLLVDRYLSSDHAKGLSRIAAQRKAAALFYVLAKHEMNLNLATVRDLVRIYQRFGAPEHKSLIELFKIGDLSVLASKSDDMVKVAISAKKANPGLTREELRHLLKS